MISAGLAGALSGWKEKQKTKSDLWTRGQKKAEQQLGGYFQGYDLSKGMPAYQGQLAGTYVSPIQSRLFGAAQKFGAGETDPLMQHYQYFQRPEERVKERIGQYKSFMQPEWETEDAAMRAKMTAMGLGTSGDVLKQQANIEQRRQAEIGLMASDMLDRYEQLGFEASEAAIQSMESIGNLQYQIMNAGLQARFDEWLRTQPEYSPVIDQLMAYLGLQGVAKTTGTASGTAWSLSGGGKSQGSEQALATT